jgi:hypothetical protein
LHDGAIRGFCYRDRLGIDAALCSGEQHTDDYDEGRNAQLALPALVRRR